MKKYLVGICTASMLLMQAQAALAAGCAQADVVGNNWHITGTNIINGGYAMTFWCPAVDVRAGSSTTKYTIAASKCFVAANNTPKVAYTISSAASKVVIGTNCTMSGTFILGITGGLSSTFTLTGKVIASAGAKMYAQAVANVSAPAPGPQNVSLAVFTMMR